MARQVVRESLQNAAAGIFLGLLLSLMSGQLLQSLLVGVSAVDPISFTATALMFAVVLAIAAWGPARRAATTDPATALRAE